MIRRQLVWLAALCAALHPAAAQQVAEVAIAPRYLRMAVDAEAPLVATAYDRDGVPVQATFQWSSSNINVAEVNERGMVKAIAPGAAVVTATTGSGTSRRYGQVTVFVRAPRGGVVVAPPPSMPVPHPEPTPGVKPVPEPPGAPSRRHIDSIVRASIDCDEPFVAAANPMRACYERRPAAQPGEHVTVDPAVAGQCGFPVRSAVAMLVQVGERGEIADVRVYAPTGCAAVDSAAEQQVRRLTFRPAERDGRPVRAWIRYVIRVH